MCEEAKIFVPEMAHHIALNKIPFKHQIGDFKFLTSFDRAGLWNEPGVGKTLSAQAYALWLVSQGNKVVCVMPPVLVSQFKGTLVGDPETQTKVNFIGVKDHFTVDDFDCGKKAREDKIASYGKNWPDIMIMSYRMFVAYYSQLLDAKFTCVIVDEAAAVKNPDSQIAKAVRSFAGNHRRNSNGVVLMTGTPVETNVIDGYGLVKILDPDYYGSVKTFERYHVIKAIVNDRPKIVGYKNLHLLNDGLMKQGRRIRKKDVSDLPPRVITELPIRLSPRHQELYDRIVEERLAEIGDRVLDLTEASALYQAMQRILLTPEGFTDQHFTNELLENLDTLLESLSGYKVVVYAWYQDSIEKLAERYKDLNPAVLNGRVTGKNRDAQKMKFIEDPTCQVIFANPKSGGIGIDGFQDVCSHVIYAEVCPYVGVFQQSIDRLHRAGQKSESVNVYVLVPLRTIAVKLRNDLIKKDRDQEGAVQDKRRILANLMGTSGLKGSLDQVEKVIDLSQDDDNITSPA